MLLTCCFGWPKNNLPQPWGCIKKYVLFMLYSLLLLFHWLLQRGIFPTTLNRNPQNWLLVVVQCYGLCLFFSRLVWKDKQLATELIQRTLWLSQLMCLWTCLVESDRTAAEPRDTLEALSSSRGWVTLRGAAEDQERGWRDRCVYPLNYSSGTTENRHY